MKKIRRFLILWGPAVLWMIIIFVFSSRPSIAVAETPLFNFLVFKFLHMVEYAILFLLILRANKKNGKITQKMFFYSLLISILYAVSDEIHQTFVPTREGRIRDVLIDTAGIAIMYMYIKGRPKALAKII